MLPARVGEVFRKAPRRKAWYGLVFSCTNLHLREVRDSCPGICLVTWAASVLLCRMAY